VINDTYLHKLDENKAVNVIDELEKNGTCRHGEIMYSLRSINGNGEGKNV
jgi:hypothetical protein